MARFKKVHTPAYVSAYRPGIDRTPPWVKNLKVAKRLLSSCRPGDWLVREGPAVVKISKADFAKFYVHDV